ncbi:small integral membrane protein 22 isoform X2 [Talpa occidentalis]|uniref:small integral membrane protein 22 isoform X2 n=1 Tax=Talpa occidentalis TaxID=50954 RepID=UPI00188ED016|nr:small integral membrane protein 22 isoform X2 [Talpa occidentalis]
MDPEAGSSLCPGSSWLGELGGAGPAVVGEGGGRHGVTVSWHQAPPAEMGTAEELDSAVQDVLGKLKSHKLFQSSWDTAAFVIFLTFVGTVLLLLLLVFIHCCCCSCRRRRRGPRAPKEAPRGVDNLALEP